MNSQGLAVVNKNAGLERGLNVRLGTTGLNGTDRL